MSKGNCTKTSLIASKLDQEKSIVETGLLPLLASSECKETAKEPVNIILLRLLREMEINRQSQADTLLGTGEGKYAF